MENQSCLTPDPICSERFDPVCPEKMDPDPSCPEIGSETLIIHNFSEPAMSMSMGDFFYLSYVHCT